MLGVHTTNKSDTNDDKSYCKWMAAIHLFAIDPNINKNSKWLCGELQRLSRDKMRWFAVKRWGKNGAKNNKANKMAEQWSLARVAVRVEPAISSIKMYLHTKWRLFCLYPFGTFEAHHPPERGPFYLFTICDTAPYSRNFMCISSYTLNAPN